MREHPVVDIRRECILRPPIAFQARNDLACRQSVARASGVKFVSGRDGSFERLLDERQVALLGKVGRPFKRVIVVERPFAPSTHCSKHPLLKAPTACSAIAQSSLGFMLVGIRRASGHKHARAPRNLDRLDNVVGRNGADLALVLGAFVYRATHPGVDLLAQDGPLIVRHSQERHRLADRLAFELNGFLKARCCTGCRDKAYARYDNNMTNMTHEHPLKIPPPTQRWHA